MRRTNQSGWWWKLTAAAGAAALLFLFWAWWGQRAALTDLRNDLRQARMEADWLEERLNDLLRPQTGVQSDLLVEDWNYEIAGLEGEDRCRVALWVAPRTYTAGDTAKLIFTSEGLESLHTEGTWDGQVFRFEAVVDTGEGGDYQVSCIMVDSQGVQKGQALGYLNPDSFRALEVSSYAHGWSRILRDGGVTLHYQFTVEADHPDAPRWAACGEEPVLELVQNGQVIHSEAIPKEEAVDWERWTLSRELTCTAQPGDELILRFSMEDSLGRTYRGELKRFQAVKRLLGLWLEGQPVDSQTEVVWPEYSEGKDGVT